MAQFGTTTTGEPVEKITLTAGDLTVTILTWGAVIQSVRLANVAHDLTLGSETLADYEGPLRYHGSIIAPVVNRLSNAQAPLGDTTLQFQVNFNDRHTLHSGDAGTQLKVWQLLYASETECRLGLTLPNGEGGFPGNRRIERFVPSQRPRQPAPDHHHNVRRRHASERHQPQLLESRRHSRFQRPQPANRRRRLSARHR